MARFELKTWMSENRDRVSEYFEMLKEEEFYNNCSLRSFGMEVYTFMANNNIKSANSAEKTLQHALSSAYLNNSKLEAEDKKTEALKKKYKGTSYMALV